MPDAREPPLTREEIESGYRSIRGLVLGAVTGGWGVATLCLATLSVSTAVVVAVAVAYTVGGLLWIRSFRRRRDELLAQAVVSEGSQ
jgi:Flp pilus assembly protein TadB